MRKRVLGLLLCIFIITQTLVPVSASSSVRSMPDIVAEEGSSVEVTGSSTPNSVIESAYKQFLSLDEWKNHYYAIVNGAEGKKPVLMVSRDAYSTSYPSYKDYSRNILLYNYIDNKVVYLASIDRRDGFWYFGNNHIGTDLFVRDNQSIPRYGELVISGHNCYRRQAEYRNYPKIKFIINSQTATQGWRNEGDKLFYYENGVKVTGWKVISGKYYYFTASGAVATGWNILNGKSYYFKKSGVPGEKGRMLRGWQTLNKKKYYFKKSGEAGNRGRMLVGWQTLDGYKYYFKRSGSAGEKGRMLKGWQILDNRRYCFDENGRLVETVPGNVIKLENYLFDKSVLPLANAIGSMRSLTKTNYKQWYTGNKMSVGMRDKEYFAEGPSEYFQITDIENNGNKGVSFYNIFIGDSYTAVKDKLKAHGYYPGSNSNIFYFGNSSQFNCKFVNGKLSSYIWQLRYTGTSVEGLWSRTGKYSNGYWAMDITSYNNATGIVYFNGYEYAWSKEYPTIMNQKATIVDSSTVTYSGVTLHWDKNDTFTLKDGNDAMIFSSQVGGTHSHDVAHGAGVYKKVS